MSFHNHTRHQTRKVLTVATSLSVTTSACTAAAARAHDAPRLGAFGPLPSAAAVSSVSPRPAASSCCRSAPLALCSVHPSRRGPPTPSLLERAQSSSKRPARASESACSAAMIAANDCSAPRAAPAVVSSAAPAADAAETASDLSAGVSAGASVEGASDHAGAWTSISRPISAAERAWAAGSAMSIVGSASARRSKSSVSGAHDVTAAAKQPKRQEMSSGGSHSPPMRVACCATSSACTASCASWRPVRKRRGPTRS
mmetsp:Transcript_21909/g.72631  ORF Transcript_21909/g.72631 Transcript_21909/m.72631 type:complete len:257 (-) Transcript_21909:97-867(-)